jgi:hypothetical protein
VLTSALRSNGRGGTLTARKTALSSIVAYLSRLQRRCLSKTVTISLINFKGGINVATKYVYFKGKENYEKFSLTLSIAVRFARASNRGLSGISYGHTYF